MTKLQEILKKEGRRQDWLADKVGATPNQVSRWVRGKSEIPLQFLIPVARALALPVEDLIGMVLESTGNGKSLSERATESVES